MTDTEVFRLSFANRLERLVRFQELQSPGPIICAEIVLIIKAAILLYGKTFWDALHDGLTGGLRNGMGFCAECDGLHRPDTMCPACIAREVAEVAQLLGPENPCQS